jgi:hypothetical protein
MVNVEGYPNHLLARQCKEFMEKFLLMSSWLLEKLEGENKVQVSQTVHDSLVHLL